MSPWKDPRRILCIRPDNMGDLLMSAPAIAALKQTFGCHITLLTSSMAKGIAGFLPTVDECLVWDVPWVKGTEALVPEEFWNLISALRQRSFDAAVIFTVFSQNPLPTAMVTMLADIPIRLAYCRENPYQLLTHWLPDEEPYQYLRHQVRRDLDLVAAVGARAADEAINIKSAQCEQQVMEKLQAAGVDTGRPWVIFHPGASEKKREYPAPLWSHAGKTIVDTLGHQIILTGVQKEKSLADEIASGIGPEAYSLAGLLSLEELISLIRMSPLLISVNTGTVHIAAAVRTRVVVLYALTNPQHAPWKAIGKILPYSVPQDLQSKNAVLRYVHDRYFASSQFNIEPQDIVKACYQLLVEKHDPVIEELVLPVQAGVSSRDAKYPELQRPVSLPKKRQHRN